MAYIIYLLAVLYRTKLIESVPINNGFSVKFNPLALKEELKQKTLGTVFVKIPQDLTLEAKQQREVISKLYHPNPPELGSGCSNQVAKLYTSEKDTKSNEDTQNWDGSNYINLPLVKQPYDNYKILVATAPPNLSMRGDKDNNSLVIYVVFSEDTSEEANNILKLPVIYFVRKHDSEKIEISKKEKADPIFIINSNRTVTGLKSKEIEKFVKFKNKFSDRYKYQISE